MTPDLEYKTAMGAAIRTDANGNLTRDGRWITGYVSTFDGPLDGQGDILSRGAFSQSLQVRPNVPFLRQHAQDRPIGKTTLLVEDAHGLLFKGFISSTPDGDETLTLIADGVILGTSIGYNTVKSHAGTFDGQRARYLDQVDLHEISPVTFPSNPAATVALSASNKEAILDAVTLAEYEQKQRRGGHPTPAQNRRYGEALTRQIERMQNDGQTLLEARYSLLFDIQERLKG